MKQRVENQGRVARAITAGVALMCALVVMLAAGVAARQESVEEKDARAEKVYNRICGDCHEVERGFEQRRTRDDWEQLVSKMVVDKGAKGTDEELYQVVAYGLSQAGIVNVNQSDVNDIRLTLKLTPAQADAVVACRKVDGGIKDFDSLKKCPGLEAAKLDPLKIAVRY